MNLAEAAILGLLQGFAEFLPISSSGHLVISQHLFGISQPGVTFEVLVHFGTMLSIVTVFWGDLVALIKGLANNREQKKLFILLLVGTIATGFVGLVLGSFFKSLFEQPVVTGFMLLITGILVFLISRLSQSPGGKTIEKMSYLDGVVTGIFQGIAIIPGISRSGSTILASLFRGLKRQAAIKYSFLLALPAIAGATLLEAIDIFRMPGIPEYLWLYLFAAFMAFLAGILSIKIFIKFLNEGKFYYFSYYCWFAGAFTILYFLIFKK
ncbi:MAG: undecaprenyl-diphosphate phosphatase [Firmicutes bacterium]|nr:undecaprenyl-diphosphate phosphatase [Bacillota bacterium]